MVTLSSLLMVKEDVALDLMLGEVGIRAGGMTQWGDKRERICKTKAGVLIREVPS